MSPASIKIFLFWPNIIGYGRIILYLICFYYIQHDFIITTTCYIIASLFDTIDGYTARALQQTTKFGEILDQLTDRCGLLGLIIALCTFYPKYMFLFQISSFIDISGHWIYMHASTMTGKKSHKNINVEDCWIIRLYYKYDVLTLMVYGNEIFYLSLYAMNFTTGPMIMGFWCFELISMITAPIACLKILVSMVHLVVGANELAKIDVKEYERIIGLNIINR